MEEASGEVQSIAPVKETARPKRVRAVPGRFGSYGGRYVPETLMAALQELDAAYAKARKDKSFRDEYHRLLADYAGRPHRCSWPSGSAKSAAERRSI